MNSGTTQTPAYWAKVMHNAVQVPPTSPRYEESRKVAAYAVSQIDALHGVQNRADSAAALPGKEMGGVQALMNGIGLGIPNAVSSDAQQYAQAASQANPGEMAVSGGIGRMFSTGAAAAVNPVLGLGAAMGIQGATADPEMAMGVGSRAVAGGVGAGLGMAAGAAEVAGAAFGGWALRRYLPTFLPRAMGLTRNLFGLLKGKVPASDIDALAEDQVRKMILKENPSFTPEVVDKAVASWRKVNRTVPKGPDVSVRAGETVTQVSDPLAEPATWRRNPGMRERTMRGTAPTTAQVIPKLVNGHWIDEASGVPLPFTKQASEAEVHAFYQQRGQMSSPSPAGTPQPTPSGGPPASTKYVAKSYKELQALKRQGIPDEQIKVDYYVRGGKLEQQVPPKPMVSPTQAGNPFLHTSTEDLHAMLGDIKLISNRAAIRAEIIRRLH